MYHGYTESQEKIEDRKRRILGTVTQIGDPDDRWKAQDAEIKRWLMRQLLIYAILLPTGSFLGGLIGELIKDLWR